MNKWMTKGWLSVGLMSGLGGLVGALLAMEIATRFAYGEYLWGIGALLGGLAGFTAIDFRKFCDGVARSYHATIAWRPYPPYWKAAGMTVAFAVARTAWVAFGLGNDGFMAVVAEVAVLSAIAAGTAGFLALFSGSRPHNMTTEIYARILIARQERYHEILLEINLITMTIWIFRDLPKVVWSFIAEIPPFAGVIFAAIGSGGNFALAAARALVDYEADAEALARKAMAVAADICVYTNDQLTIETLDSVA